MYISLVSSKILLQFSIIPSIKQLFFDEYKYSEKHFSSSLFIVILIFILIDFFIEGIFYLLKCSDTTENGNVTELVFN